MSNFFTFLQREDGCISLPRLCSMICFIIVCGMMIAELFGFEAKHLPDFMLFNSSLFAYCCGGKYLDIQKAGGSK